MGIEYLVIQGLGLLIGGGHDGKWYAGNGQKNKAAQQASTSRPDEMEEIEDRAGS